MSALDEPELQRVLVLHTFQIPKSCLINLQTPQQMRVNYSSIDPQRLALQGTSCGVLLCTMATCDLAL